MISVALITNIYTAHADGVLGCGGFVKSDVEINFSLVEVISLQQRVGGVNFNVVTLVWLR